MMNFTCNSTLEDLRVTGELPIAGSLNFHELGLIICGGCTILAILISAYSIWMHALNYTKPREQRHIIRILVMIPVYAVARFLSFWFYHHNVYFSVISDCYEAFAIASFFALLCHYTSPTLHSQKNFFRGMHPIKPWVLPVNWFAKCCGGERGIWRTPRSGLTWFNVVWAGIYQYCFVRVAMTITAVVTQYFDVYCEASNMPWFAHIWVLVINAVAVTIAMYLLIQFYIQLRADLAEHSPFLKVLAIKLVIFLSFWQTFVISILTSSTFSVLKANDYLAFPDLYVGIPSLLICIEMALFAIFHIFAYPHAPYKPGAHHSGEENASKYPTGDPDDLGPKQGGFMGARALLDALNPWDIVKAFGRGIRWMFVGARRRKQDASYSRDVRDALALQAHATEAEAGRGQDTAYKSPQGLPIAEEFSRRKFSPTEYDGEENAGLISNAAANPVDAPEMGRESPPGAGSLYKPKERYDAGTGQEYGGAAMGQGLGERYDNAPAPMFGGLISNIHPALRDTPGLALSHDERPEARAWDDHPGVERQVEAKRVRIVGSVEALGDRGTTRSLHGELDRR
ncbi:hypothetical protein V496_04339 [Pseudogymnoascus sp. VKM F-4515 (FW-2607)]|nr:hypothetical protein V496_04339 [Pseudogymnoascus sp. VKM F-4515 (FW-2607)]